MRPFFPYFGSKYTLTPKYPPPRENVVIEPFAGSACYSVRHGVPHAILYDTYTPIAETWRYLIGAAPTDILRLPIDFDSVHDLPLCDGAKYLIGWWLTKGAAEPKARRSAWGAQYRHSNSCLVWNERVRERVASQVERIKGWQVFNAPYTAAPNRSATWFIDPPYTVGGRHYAHWRVDYDALADWCTHRSGQIIVCEGARATWLPFRQLSTLPRRSVPRDRGATQRVEMVWP